MDTHTYIYEPKNTNLHERELLRRLRGFDSCQFCFVLDGEKQLSIIYPTCPSSPCCGQASFALGKNSTAGPVLQHHFSNIFQWINIVFLSQHFNISINISQISTKRTGSKTMEDAWKHFLNCRGKMLGAFGADKQHSWGPLYRDSTRGWSIGMPKGLLYIRV